MAITINTNTIASQASLNVSRATSLLHKSLARLSSGKRIVTPADDAGGLAVGMKLESALRRTSATKYNIQNGISYLQMQDGALKVSGSILDRMAELKSFYNDISKNALDRDNYNHEFKELQLQLNELQASKFNGVSLFATVEPDNNPMKIITTEDGLTGSVEMHRTGLFENLKSKYGADGVLNTGANDSYRQFVGEFTVDGVNPVGGTQGLITQDYEVGEIVYFNGDVGAGVVPGNAGYFQVIESFGNDVKEISLSGGAKVKKLIFDLANPISISDTGTTGSNFLKIGDPANGVPFAEAYQNAEEYSATKLIAKGSGTIGYEEGDIVKVKITADTSGPGYSYYKAVKDTTAGDFTASFALGEWIEVGQATPGVAATTVALGGTGRLIQPSRANGTEDHDGDGTNDGVALEQGDKLYYQGDYYQYVSINSSDHATLDAYGGAADDGYTYMEDLIDAGAVVKLNGYVDDLPRGGSPDADPSAFFEANTELKYIDRLPNSGLVRTNTIVRAKDTTDQIFRTTDDQFYKGLHSGNDGIYGTTDDYYQTTSSEETAKKGYHIDADADNNKDLLDVDYKLGDFSVADFVDYIQTLANFRAVNGGTMSRLHYAEEMLEENYINLEAATSRIMDADMAAESTKFARQNVLVQAGAAMVVQANQLSNIVLALLA